MGNKQRPGYVLVFPAVIICIALAFPLASSASGGPENGVPKNSVLKNGDDERGTVYGVLRKWFAAENALTAFAQGAGVVPSSAAPPPSPSDSAAVLRTLDETAAAVEEFKAGYVYRSYLISAFSLKNRLDEVMEILGTIKAALQQGKTEEAEQNALAARDALIEWLQYDTEMMNRIQLAYLNQNKIFIFAIIGLLIYYTLMIRSSRQLQKQERRAVAYSRSIAAAHEEERSRIARELHDSVITELRRLSFLPYAKQGDIPAKLPADIPAKLPADIPALFSAGCDALIRRIREICQALIPPDFDRLGLTESLKTLCAAFESRSGIECRLILAEGLEPIPLSTEQQLYCFRIIQEALTNIERHAGAVEASVVLRREQNPPALLVCVTDDGKGFDPQTPTDGLGIAGMRDRAAMLGGKLFFESERGAGVMVRLEIPLRYE